MAWLSCELKNLYYFFKVYQQDAASIMVSIKAWDCDKCLAKSVKGERIFTKLHLGNSFLTKYLLFTQFYFN